jgi:outer membrane lipase/esterase
LGGALASGGNWVLPDLGGQIDKLLDSTSSGDRGKTPLISIWIGANNILDAVGDSDAMKTARKAANTVGKGIERLADAAGARDFVVFNLPNLARIPEFRLFDQRNQIEARDAGKEYNDTLARRIRALEQDGLNIIDIDIYSLFRDVMADPDTYGFENVKLPCVFPSRAAADRFDQRERCSASTAKGRLFMDALHPNSRAHRIIGDVVTAAITAEAEARSSPPAARFAAEAQVIPTPLPGSWILLSLALGALPALGASRRVSSAGPSPSPWPRGPRGLRHRRAPRCSTVSQDEQAAVE